jgi:hypothetical protein
MRQLTLRERRLIAIGVLVLAIGLVYFVVIYPLAVGFMDRAAQRRQLNLTLQRDARIISALPIWRQAAEAQRRSGPRFAIAAPSDSLAAEILKEKVEHLAADDGFVLNAVDDLQAEAPPGMIRVRADMTLSLTQLTDTIRRLENEGAYVFVDYLTISADQAYVAGRLSPIHARLELTAAHRSLGPRTP